MSGASNLLYGYDVDCTPSAVTAPHRAALALSARKAWRFITRLDRAQPGVSVWEQPWLPVGCPAWVRVQRGQERHMYIASQVRTKVGDSEVSERTFVWCLELRTFQHGNEVVR